MEDDELGAAGNRYAGGVVEHPHRHPLLLVPLDVAHEARDRRMDRQRHPGLAGELAESLGPGIVHPEPAFEVDLVCRVTALEQELDCGLRRLPGGHAGRSETDCRHDPSVPSDTVSTFSAMAKRPTRIELLELDIDLRLADLWSEACGVNEWNLDVVAAFLRAAYGKGYCDALTEDAPGSLCRDHGYKIPARKPAALPD